ncbi:Aste57867_9376 [Aphanomyces stellatus]|uniref:Aste57867_9376 protein n=1 Tax=Aphanomyces stellatus TaxID=120398 RepID=A0A485KMQ4_9STRA|nr:hypothetical protein As57867_009340 [Aphanomyces stellatus]VFT86257.1 Aste57867_9376 [Aphanomyces stellatus]
MRDSVKCLRHKRKGICMVDGCRFQVNKRGLCIGHGARDTCIVPGCASLGRSAGLCNKHAKCESPHTSPCAVAGCRRRVKLGPVCRHHEAKQKYAKSTVDIGDDGLPMDLLGDLDLSNGTPPIDWSLVCDALSSPLLSSFVCAPPLVCCDNKMNEVATVSSSSLPAVETASSKSSASNDDLSLPMLASLFDEPTSDPLTWIDLVGDGKKAGPSWLEWQSPVLLKDICVFVAHSPRDAAPSSGAILADDDFDFFPLDDDCVVTTLVGETAIVD